MIYKITANIKRIKDRCLSCGTMYYSEGSDKDFGNCPECNSRETNKLLQLRILNRKRKFTKVYPHFLGADLIAKILSYHAQNYTRKPRRMIFDINNHFGLDLTGRQLTAILQKDYIRKKRGLTI